MNLDMVNIKTDLKLDYGNLLVAKLMIINTLSVEIFMRHITRIS